MRTTFTASGGRIDLNDTDFLVWRVGSGGAIEILDIAVNSERRKGKGRRMVYRLMHHADKEGAPIVYAITRADNRIAQMFYEGLRFRVVAVLHEFYGMENRVDAIMYGRNPGSQA